MISEWVIALLPTVANIESLITPTALVEKKHDNKINKNIFLVLITNLKCR